MVNPFDLVSVRTGRLTPALVCLAAALAAREPAASDNWATFSRDGLHVGDDDRAFSAEVHLRGQFRYSAPFEAAPVQPEDYLEPAEPKLEVRRARVKGQGQIGKDWLQFGFEHSLVDNRALDAKLTLAKLDWLKLSVGQWKVDYQREQIDSSGKQQFVGRSIVNRAFTFNRQKGVALHGRVGKDRPWDSQYWSGVFLGNGRGFFRSELSDQSHDDGRPMWAHRYQWNALNGGVEFSQSDLERSPAPRLSLAIAAASNRSRYTRFSGSGGEQLEGFPDGEPGQYELRQRVFDAAFKLRGFSFQHELHWKRVKDHADGRITRLRGGYAQAGYFFHELWRTVPKPLEVAVRGAFVDPDVDRPSDVQSELGFAINWFFEGHDNKLTLDVFRHRLAQPQQDLSDLHVRLQWDLTI